MKKIPATLITALTTSIIISAQTTPMETIPALVDFNAKMQVWDGFGFNYVESAQTRDYFTESQDYGGFSLITEQQKQEITELVFGDEGLRVQIIKMFLDPWHQKEPGGPFDHEQTTRHMRYFVTSGMDLTQQRGDELEIITTLYGPPAWATQQKFIGGRDLDATRTTSLCRYMADWVSYLDEHDYPVRYLSLHNEGEDFYRWDFNEGTQRLINFDYNMYWPPEQVNDFLKVMPSVLDEYQMGHVKVTNGEPSNWTRFYHWGYADGLYRDKEALSNLGLLTTHGFINGDFYKLSYGTVNSLTTDLIREEIPGLHTWITSFSWGDMGTMFTRMIHEHIYSAKVNAIIPWAGIQNPSSWVKGDPNPGTAIQVNDDGSHEVLRGYYTYKQLTRAGYRGMRVVKTMLANPQAHIIAFSGEGTEHPDAFVVSSNIFLWSLPVGIEINGSTYSKFRALRSNEDGSEQYTEIGIFGVKNGKILYDPPRGSVTTFIGIR